ncbi:MAG TPA: efflux transporter outer membrane subunit [Terriglobia bacterium]|nr:efflux transporter outer membrane subunit [Terriglobia bacterium]
MCCFLSACSVGPKYKTPPAPVPPAFKEPPPDNFKETDQWKPAAPRDDTLRGNWWEMFGDTQLNDLEAQVNTSNQNIAAAEAQFRAARAAVQAARSGLFPTLTLNAGTTRSGGGGNRAVVGAGNVVRASSGTFYTFPLDLSYEVDVWGRVRRTMEASAATAQASAADLETIRLSTHAELALDYFELRGLDEEQRLFEQTVAGFEEALQLTTNRFNQGVVSEVDVDQARTQLETAHAQAIDLDVQRAQFEHAIAIFTGKPPAELTLARGAFTGEPPVIPVALPSELLERRPDVASAERRVAFANAEIGLARAAFFPTISLTAAGGFSSSMISSLFSWPSRFWSIGPAFSEMVFDAGRRGAAVREAEASYDATVAIYRQDVLTAFQDVEDNLAALRILSEEARQQDIADESAQRSLDLTLVRYRGGITIYTEVITAQNALLANQRAAIGIRTRRMTASVLLVKALGGGWDRSQLPQ